MLRGSFLRNAVALVTIGSLNFGCARRVAPAPAKLSDTLLHAVPEEISRATPSDQDWQESVLESPRVSSDINVTNGVSFERGDFSVAGITELVVPENAHIIESFESDTVTVEVVKGLQFLGVPPTPMRIALARRYFGVATRAEDSRLSLATYGEWQNKEGRATMRVTIHVPVAIQVVGVSGLSGPASAAQGEERSSKSGQVTSSLTECYWYGPIEPSREWVSVPLRPDGAKARAKDGPVM